MSNIYIEVEDELIEDLPQTGTPFYRYIHIINEAGDDLGNVYLSVYYQGSKVGQGSPYPVPIHGFGTCYMTPGCQIQVVKQGYKIKITDPYYSEGEDIITLQLDDPMPETTEAYSIVCKLQGSNNQLETLLTANVDKLTDITTDTTLPFEINNGSPSYTSFQGTPGHLIGVKLKSSSTAGKWLNEYSKQTLLESVYIITILFPAVPREFDLIFTRIDPDTNQVTTDLNYSNFALYINDNLTSYSPINNRVTLKFGDKIKAKYYDSLINYVVAYSDITGYDPPSQYPTITLSFGQEGGGGTIDPGDNPGDTPSTDTQTVTISDMRISPNYVLFKTGNYTLKIDGIKFTNYNEYTDRITFNYDLSSQHELTCTLSNTFGNNGWYSTVVAQNSISNFISSSNKNVSFVFTYAKTKNIPITVKVNGSTITSGFTLTKNNSETLTISTSGYALNLGDIIKCTYGASTLNKTIMLETTALTFSFSESGGGTGGGGEEPIVTPDNSGSIHIYSGRESAPAQYNSATPKQNKCKHKWLTRGEYYDIHKQVQN